MAVVMVCSCSSDSPYNLEPRLQTLPAMDISRTEATLSGKCVKEKGVDMPSLWFSYGNDESMSERQEVQADADGNVSMRLSTLTAGTTYYSWHQWLSLALWRDGKLCHAAQPTPNGKQGRSAE